MSKNIDWNNIEIGSRLKVWLTFILLLLIYSVIFQLYFPTPSARLGSDYSYVLPALLDGLMWFKNNGLEIPWFTPSFCAGQPFFADPQSTFYSVPQFLNLVMTPLNTAFTTLLFSVSLIFWGAYLLMRKVFESSMLIAVFVGAVLMFNGFLPHRILVGHITYHGFALTPLIAMLLLMPIRQRINNIVVAMVAGVLLAYWVQSGFGTLILAGVLAIILIALTFALIGGSIKQFFVRGMIAGIIAISLSAAKLWAGFAFLSNFPRTFYSLPGAATVPDGIAMILGGLFLPSQTAYVFGVHRLRNVQWALAPHEWAFNFAIAFAVLGIILIGASVFSLKIKDYIRPPSLRNLLVFLSLLLSLAWPLAFNIWTPEWNAFLKTVPIINSASTPLRWVIVYIPIIAIVVGLMLEQAKWGKFKAYAVAACLFATVMQTALEPRDYYLAQGYDPQSISIADKLLKADKLSFGIQGLGTSALLQVTDYQLPLASNDTFIAGVSQILCYNPVFGYRLEKFSAAGLTEDTVFVEHDGFLNLKNPACYVFPKENGCKAGDRFRSDQIEQARNFVSYRPFVFSMSTGQKYANLLSFWMFALIAFVFASWCLMNLFLRAQKNRNDSVN